MSYNLWLLTGGALSAIAMLLHLGCIPGGPGWYRFFGAGEELARLAARGSWRPAIFAASIAALLFVASAYAFSGGGAILRLPLLRMILVAVTAVYLARAFAFPVLGRLMPGRSLTFWRWSSAVVLILGGVHAIGVWTAWASLG